MPLKTTKSTLAARTKSIPWSTLPKTFQDAVFIARRMDVRYLWIDSLCIVQDDEQDWMVESAKMCDIYQGAFLTISALRANPAPRASFCQGPPFGFSAAETRPPLELRTPARLSRTDGSPNGVQMTRFSPVPRPLGKTTAPSYLGPGASRNACCRHGSPILLEPRWYGNADRQQSASAALLLPCL